jgi:hypothetical protein
MANKRMFSNSIVGSDAFQDMPASSQLLYFHLGMEADDDGFIGNPKKIARGIGMAEDDMKILVGKRFVLLFQSGVLVIKHHRINNNWDKYNCKRTMYLEEFSQLYIKPNKAYTLEKNKGKHLQSENSLKTVFRIEENRIEENRRKELPIGNLLKKTQVQSKTLKEFRNERRAEAGNPPMIPRQISTKQKTAFSALKLMDYFRDKVMEIHRKSYLRRREDLNAQIRRQAKSCVKRFGDKEKCEEYVSWFLGEGKNDWTNYEPTHCFSVKFYQLFENKDTVKKQGTW